jgi:hypothetical protein
MLVETSLIGGIVAVGVIADRYSTDQSKLAVGSWIAQTRNFDWLEFVAQRSWLIYTRIFGSHSASKRFIMSSLSIYVALCAGSFIFLAAFFPSTYLGIMSVWRFGSTGEQAWWVASMLAGGLLYTLANAQTLYFLEILKTAPNLFRFLLVAYADLLITASISLFGIPAILTLQTIGISSTGAATLPLRVDFSRLTTGPEPYAGTRRATREVAGQPSRPEPEPFSGYLVRVGFQNPARDLAENNADYDAALDAMRWGHAPGFSRGQDGSIVAGSLADIMGVHVVRGEPYRDYVLSVGMSDDLRTRLTREAFCRAFSSGAINGSRGYTISPRMDDVAATLLRACLAGTSADVEIPARINIASLDIGKLYRTNLFITLYAYTASIASSFQVYLSISPFSSLNVEDPSQLWDVYKTFPSIMSTRHLFDQMVMNAYLRRYGETRLIMHRGMPAGSISFAIMSTAVFNILVMSVFFISFPIVKLLGKQDIIKRYVTLEKAPFAVLSTLFAVWVSIIWAMLSML